MARAVYHDADIYLLDDPLAAVDAHVGKHMFQKCIVDELLQGKSSTCNLQKKNCVIMSTNAIQYLSNLHVSRIVVLNGGAVAEVGSYSELSNNSDSLFSSFLSVMEESGRQINREPASSSSDEETKGELGKAEQFVASKISGSSTSSLMSFLSASDPSKKDIPLPTRPVTERNELDTSQAKPAKDGVNDSKSKSTTPLMTSELQEREKGHVNVDVYVAWAKAAGGTVIGLLLFLGYATDQGANIGSKWWLTYWSRNGGGKEDTFLYIYALINLVAVFTMFARVVLIFASGLRASRSLFEELLDVVLRAPMSFFDTTPTGRIVNRFSKDVYTLDGKLVSAMRAYFSTLANVFATIIVVTYATPSFALCLIPMIAFYINQQKYFTKTYRELKRLDSVSRSPLYALLGETLDGVSTIRAYNAEPALMKRLVRMIDTQQNAYFLTTTAQCWLAIRLELVGTLIIFSACLCAVLEQP